MRRPLTAKEAAAHLGVTERWLEEAGRRGDVPVLKLGRLRRYDPEQLDQYLDERREQAEREARELRAARARTSNGGGRRR